MTLGQYLARRFTKSNALTLKEARLIGLCWPLDKGWVKRYSDVVIPDSAIDALDAIANAKKSSNAIDDELRKERKRLRKLVKAGLMTRKDADSELTKAEKLLRNKPATATPVVEKAKSNSDFYASKEWREIRYKALVLHGASCQCCGASRKDGAKLHVDHIKPRSKFPKLELELSNLQVLCEDCNLGKSNKDQTDWR